MRFASGFEILFDLLDAPIHLSTIVGESLIVTHVYLPILFIGFHTWVDLGILNMDDFDIISGVTLLSPIMMCLIVILCL